MARARPRLKLLGALLLASACDADPGTALDGRDAGSGPRDAAPRDGGRPGEGRHDAETADAGLQEDAGLDGSTPDAVEPDPDPSGWCERDPSWPQREPAIPPFPLDGGPSLGPVDTEPDLPSPTVPGALLEPPDLGFGGVTIGQTATVTVELVAAEAGTYAVASPPACPAAGPFCARFTPEVLEAGDRYVFDVAYEPTAPAGRDRASVEVTSDGVPMRAIPVDGTALDRPAVDCWAPTRLEPLAPGEVTTFEVRCANAGRGTAVMTNLVVDAVVPHVLVSDAALPGPMEPRVLDGGDAAWTFELRPEADAGEVDVQLRWRGVEGGRDRAAGSQSVRLEVVPGRLAAPEALVIPVRSTGRDAELELRNVGLGPVRIETFEVDGPFEVRTDRLPDELDGGERASIRVAVSLREAAFEAPETGELRIFSAAREAPTVVRLEMDAPALGTCRLDVPGYTDLGRIRPPEAYDVGDGDRRDHEMIIGVKNLGEGPCLVDIETFGLIAGVKGAVGPEAFEPPVSSTSVLLFSGQVGFLRLAPRLGLALGRHVGRVELTPRGEAAGRAVVRFGAELRARGAQVRTEPIRPGGCPGIASHAVKIDGASVYSAAWVGPAPVGVRVHEPLPARDPVEITVEWDQATFTRGELRVETTVGRLRIPLTFGRVTDGPGQVDRFQVFGRSEVDVLFVVDDSASMARWHPNLARNLMDVVTFLDAHRRAYRLMLARTTNGALVPVGPDGRLYLTPDDTPERRGAFVERAVGRPESPRAAGSGLERPLEATLRAVAEARGAGMREDEPLAVIVVTDEADASLGRLESALDALLAIKGLRNEALFPFSVISGGDTGCRAGDLTAAPTLRLVELARRTGGLAGQLCAPDWNRTLQNFRWIPGFRSRYFLTNQPIPETVEVDVNGLRVPATCPGGRTNWTFDVSTNSVNFTTLGLPPPGADLRIAYDAGCL